jgi:3-oxoacyl-[acyl-carrier protein] reductase/2-[hydroxy(phenyl)methyl]-succinyl-CoA dehydrogenase BbsC subunit
MEVKNRVALITGATNEIGEASSLRLSQGGAKIAVCDTDQAKVDSLVSKIKDHGGEAVGVVADPTKTTEVKKAVDEVMKQFGKIDILVNNIDNPKVKGFSDLTDDDWNEAIDTNLNSVFSFCHEVVPKMQGKKHGRIINLSSLDYLGWQGKSSYSAAKSALFGFTRALALELAREGITVNCLPVSDINPSGLSEEEAAKLAGFLPVQRIGQPEDVANAVGFMASDTSKYVTGQTLFVCGGKCMHYSMSI